MTILSCILLLVAAIWFGVSAVCSVLAGRVCDRAPMTTTATRLTMASFFIITSLPVLGP